MKHLANIINLDKNKLLNEKLYFNVGKEFERHRIDEIMTSIVVDESDEDDLYEMVFNHKSFFT